MIFLVLKSCLKVRNKKCLIADLQKKTIGSDTVRLQLLLRMIVYYKVDYFYSVGGGVQMGEKAEDAVIREVLEETGVHYEIDRLAVIHENFFTDSSDFFKDLNCHEIALYFLMKPKGNQDLNSDSYTQGIRENMVWIPIDELDNYTVYPTFLKEYLSKESKEIEHIVTIE